MTYTEWLDSVEAKLTKKGARLDLRLYVYPDKHGNICVRPSDSQGQPVNDTEEAMNVIRDLWERLTQAHARPASPTNLEELLDRVTDDNIHDEVDSGEPVGREAW